MKEITKIIAEAKRALDRMSNGKRYTTSHVLSRLEKAAFSNPRDALIGSMRDVVRSHGTKNRFITQAEIGDFYNHLYGFSGGKTAFRQNLNDLLPVSATVENQGTVGASTTRTMDENSADPIFGDSDLSRELAGVFSLEASGPVLARGNSLMKKAERFVKVQLSSMGHAPASVSAVRANEHFILCNASFDTSDHTQVSLSVPVQISNGIPAIPKHFVQGNAVVEMTKESLYVHMKENQTMKKTAARNKYADERRADDFSVEMVVVPTSLEKYADLENDLIAAASHFSVSQVRLATGVLASELVGLGVMNPQINVSSSNAKTLVLSASIPTSVGRKAILVPVDMPNGRPVIPSKFAMEDKTYPMTGASIRELVGTATSDQINRVSRQTNEMSKASYNELMGIMASGASAGDYRTAEDALSSIGSRFEGAQYLAALDRFTKLLKHASKNTERDQLIKSAMDSGDLISLPTSVEPYCPRLGLPMSKISFDENGRMIPTHRTVALDDTFGPGALISSSRISIT
jgi:hypothetical protein